MEDIRPSLVIPPPLRSGDKIGILCTARKISAEELEPALKILQDWGFEPVLGSTIGAEDNQYGGDDIHRAEDMQDMLLDPTIKAIICARGGYGTVRMIDLVDWSVLREHPKWILGYSDVTVLHDHLYNHGIATIHGSMPINFKGNTPEALEGILRILSGDLTQHYSFKTHKLNVNDAATGTLIGGNLSVLYSILGSESMPQPSGSILFIEDLDEYLYHIDRMMMNLRRCGFLEHLNGIVVGAMTDMNDNTIPYGKTAEEIIHEHVHDLAIPVAFGFPAGHISDNRPLVMNIKYELSVSYSGSTLKSKAKPPKKL